MPARRGALKYQSAKPGLAFGSLKSRPPVAYPGQRIGLLGGSFNPPHEGHVRISQWALKRLGLDAVWWLVSPGNPLKSHSDLARFDARISAARALITDARIRVTGFEGRLAAPFTASTLAHLKARRGATTFIWLMGADNLKGLHRWHDWRGIMATFPIAVMDRPGQRYKALASRAAIAFARARLPEGTARLLARRSAPTWVFIGQPLSAQSSTALRARGITL